MARPAMTNGNKAERINAAAEYLRKALAEIEEVNNDTESKDTTFLLLGVGSPNVSARVVLEEIAHKCDEMSNTFAWLEENGGMTLAKEYMDAVHNADNEMRCFKLRDNNPVHTKALRNLRDSLRKQTLALQGERARQAEEKKPGRK